MKQDKDGYKAFLNLSEASTPSPSIPVKEGEVLEITKGADDGVIFIRGNNKRVIADLPNDEIGHKDAKAICTAVNNTYGKGFNPAAMEELYKALEKCQYQLQTWDGFDQWGTADEEADEIAKTALQNAKSIKP